MESVIQTSDRDAQALYIQLNNAMLAHDMQAVARAMRDLAELDYFIQIVTRHIAKNGDRLEITSTPERHSVNVNGQKHIPTILKYRKILNHLDRHPKDYGEYFFHKNELSPEDYEWMCIDPAKRERLGEKYR
jgi:hypothetical protein